MVDVSHFQTNGYREHSAATRYQSSAKLVYRFDHRSTLTLVADNLYQGDTQDPLGLTRALPATNSSGRTTSRLIRDGGAWSSQPTPASVLT